MNNVRRGSISVPVAPSRETKDKTEGLKTISSKIEELANHVQTLEHRKLCECEKVESKLLKEISKLSQQIKDLIES